MRITVIAINVGPRYTPFMTLSPQMFERDAVAIMTASLASPDTMAFTLMFAVATANCPFMQSVDTMIELRKAAYNLDLNQTSTDVFTPEQKSRMGCGLTTSKMIAYSQIWIKRHDLHAIYKDMYLRGQHIEFWHYGLDNIRGLGMVKSAFATQMLFGQLGCIDIHNARELGSDTVLTGKSKKQRAAYLELQSVKTCQAWWDEWCVALAERKGSKFTDGQHVSSLHSGAVLGFGWNVQN